MSTKLKISIQRILTPDDHMNQLHQLFGLMLDLFAEYNIFTMAMSGTLLGIVRSNDYILWDDDIDMAVNFSDYTRIMDLNTLLNPMEIEIIDQGAPWIPGKKWRVLKMRYTENPSVFIDLFPFEFKGHTYRMPPRGAVPKDWYRRNVFKVNELYPLQFLKLRDLWVPCPNNPIGFVNRSYGEEAVKTCIITHQHLPQKQRGLLKRLEKSVEDFVGLSVYGKKFPCDLIPGDTSPLPPVAKLRWLHWLFLIGLLGFFVGMVIMTCVKKKRGG